MKGVIAGKQVEGRLEIESVDVCRLQFPRDPECGTIVEPPIYPVEEIFKRIDILEENVASLNQTINGLNEVTGRRVFELSEGVQSVSMTAYFMGSVGIATGVAGIGLALIALFKRK
ncbi:MAG: hypothetical protein ACREBU_04435 [Nitrososphaera sp.]